MRQPLTAAEIETMLDEVLVWALSAWPGRWPLTSRPLPHLALGRHATLRRFIV